MSHKGDEAVGRDDLAGFLLAYFHTELDEDGEQIRFAVSTGERPDDWTVLNGGAPVLISHVGTGGVRDPFLVRDPRRDVFVLLATDLRTWPDHDTAWHDAVRTGSRSIVIWESPDLLHWTEPRLVEVAPADAGNAWAPKAFWSEHEQQWLVFWASSSYPPGSDRTPHSHQRILVAGTRDFRTFSEPRVHLDPGHDVIDLTFLEDRGDWYRFSANALVPGGNPDIGHHIYIEHGPSLEEPEYEPLRIDAGKPELQRGEGPAVATAIRGDRWYLLIDEFLLRGYQLFETDDLSTGQWRHVEGQAVPTGARHGSLLAITDRERDRLLAARRT